jgi:hypothetical protein
MSPDQEKENKAPTVEEVRLAYDTYRAAKTAYLDVLARYVTAHPEDPDPLFVAFTKETALLRVMHAVCVGYGLSDEIYKLSSRAQVAQAQLRGFMSRNERHSVIVLTEKDAGRCSDNGPGAWLRGGTRIRVTRSCGKS